MAGDPWSVFADAPVPAAAPGGGDPWAGFADAPAPDKPHAPWTLGEAVLPSLSTINGLVRSAANSVPVLGAYADKLDAATDSALTGKPADKAMADQKAQDDTFADQHPVASGAAGFVGAAGGSVAMLPEWGLGAVGGLGSRVVGGAVGGGTLGAADAMARGQDPSLGAGVGALGGAAGPIIGKGVGAAYQGARNLIQGAPADVPGVGRLAAAWLRDGVAGMSPEDLAAARAAAGPSAMVADASPALTDYAGSVADNNGAGKQVVRDAYQARMDARNSRVNALVDQNLGPSQSPVQFAAGLDAEAQPFAQAQGEAIRGAGPVDVSGTYRDLAAALPNAAPGSQEHGAYAQALGMLREERPAAPPPSTWERDPVGSGDLSPDPAAGDAPGIAATPENTYFDHFAQPRKPDTPRPMTARDVIRSLGGVRDLNGDLTHAGVDEMGPGVGKLIQAPNSGKGVTPDQASEVLAQLGYFGDPETAMAARNNDLLTGALTSHPTYPEGPDGAAWLDYDRAMQDWQEWKSATAGDTRYRDPRMPGRAPAQASGYDPMDMGLPPNAPAGGGTTEAGPTTNAARILSARQEIDDRLYPKSPGMQAPSSAMRKKTGAYYGARGGLSDALRDQVPGYADATDALAGIARRRDALNDGLDALGSGKQAVRPDDFAAAWAALSPEEQAAYRVGMRANVDQALGTRPNDFGALKGVTQGENGWNGQKLATAFGNDAAGAVNRGIDQETQIARNTQKVIGGSPTGEKVQRSRLTQPGGRSEGLFGAAKDWWNELYIDKPATYLPTGQIAGRVMSGAYERARNEIAPQLVKTGPEADALFSALLAQRQRQAALAPPAAVDPLVRALMMGAGQYAGQ